MLSSYNPPFPYSAAFDGGGELSMAPSSEASTISSLRSACSGALQSTTSMALQRKSPVGGGNVHRLLAGGKNVLHARNAGQSDVGT